MVPTVLRPLRAGGAALALVLSLVPAESALAANCVPGGQSECACTNGTKGFQVCRDDGARFGPCHCFGTATETPAEASAPTAKPATGESDDKPGANDEPGGAPEKSDEAGPADASAAGANAGGGHPAVGPGAHFVPYLALFRGVSAESGMAFGLRAAASWPSADLNLTVGLGDAKALALAIAFGSAYRAISPKLAYSIRVSLGAAASTQSKTIAAGDALIAWGAGSHDDYGLDECGNKVASTTVGMGADYCDVSGTWVGGRVAIAAPFAFALSDHMALELRPELGADIGALLVTVDYGTSSTSGDFDYGPYAGFLAGLQF